MEKRNAFINWIDEKKLKHITSVDFAALLEYSFSAYLDVNIWEITEETTYQIFCKKLKEKKQFRRKDRKRYKAFLLHEKLYGSFLKTYSPSVENAGDNNEEEREHDSTLLPKPSILYSKEFEQIKVFFDNEEFSIIFYSLFVYSKKYDNAIILDVRATIIGVKKDNERLRYYCDKSGLLRFVKIECDNIELSSIQPESLDDLYELIDSVNTYFDTHKSEVELLTTEAALGFVYHKTFGFGKIVSQSDSNWEIIFDTKSQIKKIQINHSSCTKINEECYLKKIKPQKQSTDNDDSNLTKQRVPWDKYESALLIEAFWKIENNVGRRTDILNKLSSDLRKKAINQGLSIDDTFRNYNGVSMQLSCLVQYFFPERASLHKSAIFEEVVNIFKTDSVAFNRLLEEAHLLINGETSKDNRTIIAEAVHDNDNIVIEVEDKPIPQYTIAISEADFYTYEAQKYAKNHESDGKAHRAARYAKKCIDIIRYINQLFSIDLFGILSLQDLSNLLTKLEKRKNIDSFDWCVFVLKEYVQYIKTEKIVSDQNVHVSENQISVIDYKKVLLDCFPDGFAFENPLRKKRFVHRYEELLGKSFKDSDTLYLKTIHSVGFISEGKVYLDTIVPPELKAEIKDYIDNTLINNVSAVYYSALFLKFREQLNSLFSEDMLKSYLQYVFTKTYSFTQDYLSKVGAQVDVKQELINVFLNCGHPLDIAEIYDLLPSLSHEIIDSVIRDRDFVVNYRGKSYFYKDIFIIDDEQLDAIDSFIAQRIDINEQLSGSELYNFIISNQYDLIEANPGVTDLGFRNIIRLKLECKYNFRGDVISRLGSSMDVKTLYSDFCKERETFSFFDLEEFRHKINKSYIDWDAVFTNSIRINAHKFIRRDLVTFDVVKIDSAIARYCNNYYVSFVDVINYTDFPTMEVNWNSYVLESYLYINSKRFKLVHATFNGDKPVGAIVNRNSPIETFDDLLIDVIKNNSLFDEESAFAFLLENDYIRTRKVKNINYLIDEAKKES